MVHLTTALDPASAVPLYEQLYRSLAAEMRAGTLTAGTRMPGKRRLAAELSVSVNTVDTAYQMLAAEGYLTARERSGFTVQEYLALPQGVQPPAAHPAPPAEHPAETAPPTLSFYLTNPSGSGAAQGSPHNSLGGYRSTTQVSASAMKNLFDDVTVAESIVGDTEYRFLDVYNSGDSSATKVQVFVSSDTSSSGTEITLGYNSTNQPHEDSWDGEDIANEDTAPASPSLTFGTYTRASPLHLGTIPAGRSVRICVKRTVTAGVPWTARDVGTIAVRYLGD